MSDTKTLEAVQDKLSGNQRDKIDFIQAEQNVLFGDLGTFSSYGAQANPLGYSAEGFKLYEHSNSALMLSEVRAANGQEKVTFIKKGRLLDGLLTPTINMQRVYKDPLDRTKILDVKTVSLDNFFMIKKQISSYTQQQIAAATTPSDELTEALSGNKSGGANYEKLKYGLTGLDFILKNQNPFAASRMVDVSIQFTLESILALDYANSNGFKLRDLITFSKGKPVNQEAYGGYSLRLAIGYADTNLQTSSLNSHDPETTKYLLEVLPRINNILLELELVDYDITVADSDSSATLTLNYVSFIEDFSKKMSFDIFAGKILSNADISAGVKNRNVASSLKQEMEALQSRLTTLRAAREAGMEYNRMVKTQVSTDDSNKALRQFRRSKKSKLKELEAHVNKAFKQEVKDGSRWKAGGNKYFSDKAYLDMTVDLENIDEDLEAVQGELDPIQGAYEAKVQEINDRLVFQNKIAKYNIILENIFRNNKVYETEMKTSDLVLFSNAATLEFEALVREGGIQAGLSVTAVEEALASSPFSLGLDPETASESQRRYDISQIQGSKQKSAKNASKSGKKAAIKQHATTVDAAKAVAAAKTRSGEDFDEVSAIVDARIAGGGPLMPVGETYKFYYIYLGDILDAALAQDSNGTMYKKMKDSKVGIILGSISVQDPQNPNNTISVNLADFPISLKYFVRFFKKNIVEKDIDQYDVTKFLQDLATQLISPAINSTTNNFGKSHKNPVQIKITTLPLMARGIDDSGVGDPSYLGEMADFGTRINLEDPLNMFSLQEYSTLDSVEQVSDTSTYKPVHNYFYMYGTNDTGFTMGSANASTSQSLASLRAQRGVYSFTLGGEYDSIDLKYSFQKVKKKYQTEMMASRAMEKGEEYREAWNQYDLTIEMVGNTIFYPGMHIYSTLNLPDIDYQGADPFLALNLGLEGYYLVTNVENKIEGQFWTTSITAKWQSATGFGRGSSRPLPAGGSTGS